VVVKILIAKIPPRR